MALGRDEATQIVRFCLAGDGWGTCLYEGDAHILKLVLTGTDRVQARRFEGASFEDVLAQAVHAGVLKATCVNKQIAFLGRASPPSVAPDPGRTADTGRRRLDGAALFPEATSVLSALVHETQRERGISALYAASRGRLFAEELAAQWRVTDRRHEALAAFREAHADRMAPAAAQQLAVAGSVLGAVTTARVGIEDLKQRPTEIIQMYTRLNRELLLVIDRLMTHVVEPPQRSTAVAWMALLYAKEKTGIERAQLASVFERDRYVEDQYQTVLGAIAGRQSYLHLFSAAAPAAAAELLQAKLATELTTAVEEMERIAVAHRKGGFGVDSTAWFSAITGQIDSLADVEMALRTNLTP